MPPGGAPVHGEMSGDAAAPGARELHVRRLADALAAAEAARTRPTPMLTTPGLSPSPARDFDKATHVPAEFVAEQARVVSAAQHAWAQGAGPSDFAAFRPHLERIIELKRQYVTFFPGQRPSLRRADRRLRAGHEDARRAGGLRRAPRPSGRISAPRRGAPADGRRLPAVPYGEPALIAFSVEVIAAFGFDFARGRQDKSIHPFCTSFGSDDVRITTRFVESLPALAAVRDDA